MLYAYIFEKQKNTNEQGFCKSVDKGILAWVSDSDGSQHRSFALGSNFSLFEIFLGYGKLTLISLPIAAMVWLIEKLESKTQQNS